MNMVVLTESYHNVSPSLANLMDFSQLSQMQQVFKQQLLSPMQLLDGHQNLYGTGHSGLGGKRTADERDNDRSAGDVPTHCPCKRRSSQVSAGVGGRPGDEVLKLQGQRQLNMLQEHLKNYQQLQFIGLYGSTKNSQPFQQLQQPLLGSPYPCFVEPSLNTISPLDLSLKSTGLTNLVKANSDLKPAENRDSGPSNGGPELDYQRVLYENGMCKWPGCKAIIGENQAFLIHLNHEHGLDDRSTTQSRLHMQAVQQMELKVQKERDRSSAVMTHRHYKHLLAQSIMASSRVATTSSPSSGTAKDQQQHTEGANYEITNRKFPNVTNIKLDYKFLFRIEPIS